MLAQRDMTERQEPLFASIPMGPSCTDCGEEEALPDGEGGWKKLGARCQGRRDRYDEREAAAGRTRRR